MTGKPSQEVLDLADRTLARYADSVKHYRS